jgi:hypothetical protein
MTHARAIVPPTVRVVVRRVMRRPKTRRVCRIFVATAALGLGTALLGPTRPPAVLTVVLAGFALASAVAFTLLWFLEQPREIVIREVRRDVDRSPGPIVH